jgi:multiple sugar transport system permease protein
MSSVAVSATRADTETAPLGKTERSPPIWGVILLAPYVLVFLAFVVYPVC